jgi:uncharacterized protein
MTDGTVTTDTAVGPARLHVAPGAGRGLVVLGHGAGGGVETPDLVAVRDRLVGRGWTVVRVEQPYRVRGRRAPDRAVVLDAAWTDAVTGIRADHPGPLVVGGRSSGARVACRTAHAVAAAAVTCLAFPLHPPSRPDTSRIGELLEVADLPVLVVQGERDPFGGPGEFPAGPAVVGVAGDHSLRRPAARVGDLVADWLDVQRLA